MLCIRDQVIRMEKKRKYSFQGHQKFNLILQLSHHHCPLVKPGVCLTSVSSRQLIQGSGFLLQFLKRVLENPLKYCSSHLFGLPKEAVKVADFTFGDVRTQSSQSLSILK